MGKRYYAAVNSYGTPTSVGLVNTWGVMVFETKQDRDDYVSRATDIATRAIPRDQVTSYVTESPKAFSGEYYGIVDNLLEYTPQGRPAGYVGHVTVCSGHDYGIVSRFNG